MPITQAVNGGGTSPTYTRRVYYIGTDELLEGYALCYNFDASDVSAENLTLSAGVAEECPARRLQVEKPSVNNCVHFAGVVSNKSAGVTGPGWVEINLPGSVCNIYAAASVDHGATGTGMNTGQMLTFSTDQYYFKYTGVPGSGSAIVLQDVDRSTTNGLVMAELQTGMPSGGFQLVTSAHTAGVISDGGVLSIAPFGVTAIDSTGFTAARALTAALTCCLLVGDGEWIGQTKQFQLLASLDANGLVVTAIPASHTNSSLLTFKLPVSLSVSLVIDDSRATMIWDGMSWNITTNAVVSNVL